MTMALAGPAGKTNASPWPTSHATRTHPVGGQLDTTARTGICTTAATTATDISTFRGPGRRANQRKINVAASKENPPNAPLGHGNVAPCRLPKKSATHTNQRHGQPASCASSAPSPRQKGAVIAAPKPSSVVTATTGSASMFAGIATILTRPEIAATTGAVTTWAAAATASDSAIKGGTRRRRKAPAQPGAMSSNAAVASTDIAKPASTANCGRQSSNPSTAAESIGTPSRRRPLASAASAIAAMTAARTTLGDGRATTTNASKTTKPIAAHVAGPAPRRRNPSRTAPTTIEQFVPLTATK